MCRYAPQNIIDYEGNNLCPNLNLISQSDIYVGGPVAHINDNTGLHSIGNYTSSLAVTLHVYSPPIRRVHIFDTTNNSVIVRVPGFFSIDGIKTGKD